MADSTSFNNNRATIVAAVLSSVIGGLFLVYTTSKSRDDNNPAQSNVCSGDDCNQYNFAPGSSISIDNSPKQDPINRQLKSAIYGPSHADDIDPSLAMKRRIANVRRLGVDYYSWLRKREVRYSSQPSMEIRINAGGFHPRWRNKRFVSLANEETDYFAIVNAVYAGFSHSRVTSKSDAEIAYGNLIYAIKLFLVTRFFETSIEDIPIGMYNTGPYMKKTVLTHRYIEFRSGIAEYLSIFRELEKQFGGDALESSVIQVLNLTPVDLAPRSTLAFAMKTFSTHLGTDSVRDIFSENGIFFSETEYMEALAGAKSPFEK